MHDNEQWLDPKLIESDKRIMAELEREYFSKEANDPQRSPANNVERAPLISTRLRNMGRSVLRFFTKEEILFFRIIDDD